MWLFFAFLNAFFESLSNLFGKKGAVAVDEYAAAFAQRFFSLFVLLPLLFFVDFRNTDATFWIATLISVGLATPSFILVMRAIKISPLSQTLPLLTTTPLFLLITSPLITGEVPDISGIFGVFFIVLGVYMLNVHEAAGDFWRPFRSLVHSRGSRLMLVVAIIWSITSNFDKIAIEHSSFLLYALVWSVLVTVALLPFLRFSRGGLKGVFRQSRALAPIGITAGFSHIFQMAAISIAIVPYVISIKRTSTLFGVLWGKVFFKEERIKERLLGTILALIGVALVVV